MDSDRRVAARVPSIPSSVRQGACRAARRRVSDRHDGQFRRQRLAHSTKGASFIAVLVAMLIVAALYFGYLKLQTVKSERAVGVAAIDASRVVACRTNRQTIERALVMWSVNHPDEAPSLAALKTEGIGVPSCPEGGQYALDGGQVRCSKHP